MTHLFNDAFSLAVIAAVARNGVIGQGNTLPWRLPEDLRHFRALTAGHTVIMGRKTRESLPHALPDRQNIVVTRNRDFHAEGSETVASLAEAINKARLPAPAFCIGGGDLYAQAIPHAAVLYLTEIDADFAGDVFFPDFNCDSWQRIAHEPHFAPDAGFAYAFNTYVRKILIKDGGQQACYC